MTAPTTLNVEDHGGEWRIVHPETGEVIPDVVFADLTLSTYRVLDRARFWDAWPDDRCPELEVAGRFVAVHLPTGRHFESV